MRRLDREERNLRAAVDWSLAHDDTDIGLRIIGADLALVPAAWPAARGPRPARAAPRRVPQRSTRACGSRRSPRRAASRTGWTTSPRRQGGVRGAARARDGVGRSAPDGRRALRPRVPVDGRPRRRSPPGPRAAGPRPVPRRRPRGRRRSARARASCWPSSWPATTTRRPRPRDRRTSTRSAGRGSQLRGRRQPHAAVRHQLAARATPRLAWRRASEGLRVLLGHGQRVRARPQPRHGGDHPARRTATPSSGRGSRGRPIGWSARRA